MAAERSVGAPDLSESVRLTDTSVTLNAELVPDREALRGRLAAWFLE